MDRTIVCSKVLMHMMDIVHHSVHYSEGFVELNPTSLEYYDKKLEKLFYHPNLKEISLGNFASIVLRAKQMFEGDAEYLEHSRIITKEWFDIASLIQDMPNSNLLFIQCRVDGMDHMAIIKLNYKVAPCMVEDADENGHKIMRISQRQSVPSKAQNVEEAIVINVETNQVYIVEKRFMIDGKMGYYLNDQYLKGQPLMTDKEKIKVMNKAIQKVDDAYQVNPLESTCLVKQALTECMVENKDVKPIEIASKIFEKDYGAQEECVEMMKDLGVSEDDVVIVNDSIEKMAKCKIITDTDMEIVMSVEDYLNEVNIRKILAEDGSYTLILEHIRDLVVK